MKNDISKAALAKLLKLLFEMDNFLKFSQYQKYQWSMTIIWSKT